jgi:ribosome maturation protein SDO1
MSIQQPSNQVKLTNVAIVRYKVKGQRFEVACYRNKVISWRKGIEKDIDEVVQIRNIFVNVSKGIVAKKKALIDHFEMDDEDAIIKLILDKGEVQVSDKERKADLDRLAKDIVTIVHQKCVNKETQLPFPVAIIEEAMKDVHFAVSASKSAKQQALILIRQLQEQGNLPIQRSEMRLRIIVPNKIGKKLKESLDNLVTAYEEEDWSGEYECIVRIDPGVFRDIDDLVKQNSKGEASVDILDLKALEISESEIQQEQEQEYDHLK